MSWVQRSRIAILFFCLGLFCLSQQPRAYWQSRDSNYNIAISGGGGLNKTLTYSGFGANNWISAGVAVKAVSGTVAFDASAISTASAPSVTTDSVTIGSIGSGANRVAVAALNFINGSGASANPSMTLQTVPMTRLGSIDNANTAGTSWLFGLANPTTGATASFIANWTGNNQASICYASFTNADQTGGVTTFHDFTTAVGASQPSSVTVPNGITGQIAFAAHGTPGNFTSSASGTNIGLNNGGSVSSQACNWDTY